MRRIALAIIPSLLLLGGCAATLVTGIPISSANVLRSPDGKVSLWKGTIMGRPIGDSTFSMQRIDGAVECSGKTTGAGAGSATCSDGSAFTFQVPKHLYGGFSGAYVEKLPNGIVMASGWGSQADLDQLEKMLPQR